MKCQPVTHLKNSVPRSVQEEKWYTGKSKAEAAAKAEKDLGQKASWQCGWPGGQFDHFGKIRTANKQRPTTKNNNQRQKKTQTTYDNKPQTSFSEVHPY